jgi:hypothetical protein
VLLVKLVALNTVIDSQIVRSSIYKINKITYGAFEAELDIPLSQPLSSGWELELDFDDMVILHVSDCHLRESFFYSILLIDQYSFSLFNLKLNI